MYKLLLTLFLLLCLVAPASADCLLTVYVVDSNGESVLGALVRVYDIEANQVSSSYTDWHDGSIYTDALVYNGERYLVVATLGGYAGNSGWIYMPASGNTSVTIHLN